MREEGTEKGGGVGGVYDIGTQLWGPPPGEVAPEGDENNISRKTKSLFSVFHLLFTYSYGVPRAFPERKFGAYSQVQGGGGRRYLTIAISLRVGVFFTSAKKYTLIPLFF